MGAAEGQAWLVGGAPGSGKSALGRGLAAALHAVLLDQDVLTGPLTRVICELVGADPEDLDDPRVRRALGTSPYEALLDTARGNLDLGRTVVLVAPFTSVLTSQEGAVRLRRLECADLRVVWTCCPPEGILRRLAARAAPRDQRKLADQARVRERAALLPVLAHRVVDTTRDPQEQIRTALGAPPATVPDGGRP